LRENAGNLRMLFFFGEVIQIWVNFADQNVQRSLSPIMWMEMKWSGVLSA
jgi:hypothetical protein